MKNIPPAPDRRWIRNLALPALGVVFGDIGTSPLYTLRECLNAAGTAPVEPVVLGMLSMIFWTILFVVALKYVAFVMRADNQGEGGIMALLALADRSLQDAAWRRWLLMMAGLCGTALFYGDGVITPAISVLSAVEGLEIATPLFQPYVIPIPWRCWPGCSRSSVMARRGWGVISGRSCWFGSWPSAASACSGSPGTPRCCAP